MNKKLISVMAGIFILILSFTNIASAEGINNHQTLSARQQAIIPISAFTAKGDLKNLKIALNEGLDAGLSINEIKEVLVQMYAYAGFPRSLNGINTFIDVLKVREQKGIKDVLGREAALFPKNKTRLELGTEIQTYLMGSPAGGATYEFSPEIDIFLKEHLFGDIFGRDILDYQSREVATVAALASLGGAENQLRGHFNVSMNIGITPSALRELIDILRTKVGRTEAKTATTVLNNLLKNQ